MGALGDLIAAELATAGVDVQSGATRSFVTAAGGSYMPDDGTATATGGAATLNKQAGKITSEALTTAGLAEYTLTLTNSAIAAADMVFPSIANGTNTQGTPILRTATPAAGSVVIIVRNNHVTEAFNGTLVISFIAFKA